MAGTPGAGADAIFSGTEKTPKKKDWKRTGCKEGERRFTVIASEEQMEALKNIAYWSRKSKKDVLAEALDQYIDQHKQQSRKKRP